MTFSIPTLIHQTWADSEVPAKWREFQRSWIRHHPNWEYRLWTDLELRQLIRECYRWFLPIYDHYPEPIQRVDAARYFLMHRFGGVYVDLDFECLRPLEPLLKNREVVLGYEPKEHLSKPIVQAQGLTEIVANAFLASAPGHPFWNHVFLELVGAHRLRDPLAATGPFFLTKAFHGFSVPGAVSLVPSKFLYPGTHEQSEKGLFLDPAWREKSLRDGAYGIHHWSGSWWIGSRGTSSRPEAGKEGGEKDLLPFTLMDHGSWVAEGKFAPREPRDRKESLPLVSCLMVTRSSRLGFAKRAITCFRAQSYLATELVIVDDGEGGELRSYVESLADPRLVYSRVADEGMLLGKLRNLAVSRASGEYVMQWDDDDLHHSRRIETQMAVLRGMGAKACLLSRWKIWWTRERRLAVSKRRGWEGSILCAKEKLPRYDESLRSGEDSISVRCLASREKIVFVDAPWLYTYVVHGGNTTPEALLNDHWVQATEFFWGRDYERAMRSLVLELPESVREEITREAESGGQEEKSAGGPVLVRSTDLPRVLILSPVKDGMSFIETYFAGLQRLDYPAASLSLALLESDSRDGTFAALSAKAIEAGNRFARTEVFKRDYCFQVDGSRSDPEIQLLRRSILARSRNFLLSRALRDEDWVLWLDFDVIDYPADVIQQLLAKKREIIVPHCVIAPGGRTFDLNTFIRNPGEREDDSFITGAILQPPKGAGRKYLQEVRDLELVEVDAVGGTMLLVKADLHREGLHFPVAPYRRHLETEGLSFLARDMGFCSWGAPRVEVVHANR